MQKSGNRWAYRIFHRPFRTEHKYTVTFCRFTALERRNAFQAPATQIDKTFL